MKRFKLVRALLKGALLFALMLLPQLTEAQQYFTYNKQGDLLFCFRNPGNPTYEVVADFSNVLSLVNLSVGSVTNITVYSTNNLYDAFTTSLTGIQWSVIGTITSSTTWSNYPLDTLWFTVPRSDPGTQSTPPARQSSGYNGIIKGDIGSVGVQAGNISKSLGSTNSDNNLQVLLEPVDNNDKTDAYEDETYSWFVAASVTASYSDPESDFGGAISFGVENVTPAPFSSPVVSDFYQSVINGRVDPTTGQTNGNSTYLGYFTLNPNGTMTFTRQSSTNSTTTTPPPPPTLTITRSGNTATISFMSTNGATYTLLYTNSAGLSSAPSSWPSNTTSVTGNGAVESFSDPMSDPNRFYRVSAH